MTHPHENSLLEEPEKTLPQWLLTNAVALVVGLLAFALIGFVGYQISTGGYEVTGGLLVVTSITLACHVAEFGRRRVLRALGAV
ncbi:hypothetical protein [Aquisalimonas sp.]|uniref:hypothetical protein n=1 Tax=Aquisalimonas sp. TaxID=1872621 RepID=UPI0025BEB5E9|nr:hypothetical protein [Aquisalimonas sp.]